MTSLLADPRDQPLPIPRRISDASVADVAARAFPGSCDRGEDCAICRERMRDDRRRTRAVMEELTRRGYLR